MLVKAPELIFFSNSNEFSLRVLSTHRMMMLLKSGATSATFGRRDDVDGGEVGGVGLGGAPGVTATRVNGVGAPVIGLVMGEGSLEGV